jgi:hypothetical protein
MINQINHHHQYSKDLNQLQKNLLYMFEYWHLNKTDKTFIYTSFNLLVIVSYMHQF